MNSHSKEQPQYKALFDQRCRMVTTVDQQRTATNNTNDAQHVPSYRNLILTIYSVDKIEFHIIIFSAYLCFGNVETFQTFKYNN
ncbi:hypothetical protein T01_1427 [Trichinella spiralis]|uniref:Uncharacterized protein n=1 Tax=Trichinella spiralis TaxID=6334 RepID=A0A0V1BEG7_TRISP|nr:hypothetical protein T01_1512 [Trichinella spiralis]KRY35196.1 hypothetical protein T01_1427 [Trichinella spiralis]